jgi:Mrp family chromosome partitioning ATPase
VSLIERAVAASRRDPPPGRILPRRTTAPARFVAEAGADRPFQRSPEIPPERRFTLDLARFARRGHLVPGNLRSPLAQEVNALKRGLYRALEEHRGSPWEGPLVLMVTSTKPGEGKSFVSLNLALSFLFVDGRRVLLVDADGADGGLSRELGVPGRPGLSDELRAGELRLDDRLLGAERHRLEVLPAGSTSSVGALDWTRQDCQRLAHALRRLTMVNEVIVIDTPPVSVLPTAHLLADYVDHILFVVGAGQTRPDEIALALAQLSDRDATSFVLNRVIAAPGPAEYSYGSRT